jgi:signal transduction histidine kinase
MSSAAEQTAEPAKTGASRGVHRRAVLLATALALLGVLASLALWQTLRRSERDQIHRTTQAVAEGLAHQLELRLESRVAAVRSLANFWAEYRFASRSRWIQDAELYARNNQFASLARVDSELRETWVVTPHRALAPTLVDPEHVQAIHSAKRLAAREGLETHAGPFRIQQGGYALWVVVPVLYHDSEPGLLVATLALDSLLDRFLSARARGYSVSLRQGSEELYRRGKADWDARAADFSIEPLDGIVWSASVQPTPALLSRDETPLPEIALAAGISISALLAMVVWLAHLARARARGLADANREIRREMATTRSAEIALRKLNADLEARVEARTAELRELVSELEAFNYSVSHDLRSPLGAVVNFASILHEDYRDTLDAQGRDYLGRITSSAESALDMIRGLLTFSRLGREELKRGSVDVRELVADVVAELTAGREQGEARIELGPLPPAHADVAMLRVVFSNLVSNALKFSRNGSSPRVQIGASEANGEVVYHVKDNGVGFDPQLAHKLFSVFERLHSKEEFGGSGVGLATAARIVRRHGGRIWADGAPGEGASFYFALPKREGTHEQFDAH